MYSPLEGRAGISYDYQQTCDTYRRKGSKLSRDKHTIFEVDTAKKDVAFISVRQLRNHHYSRHYKWLTVLSAVLLVFCAVAVSLPFENLFWDGKAPAAVVEYTTGAKVLDTVYGEASCMVVCENKPGKHTVQILPRKGDGYLLEHPGTHGLSKINRCSGDQGGTYSVFKVLGGQDHCDLPEDYSITIAPPAA